MKRKKLKLSNLSVFSFITKQENRLTGGNVPWTQMAGQSCAGCTDNWT
ncbi:hypothetical protein AB9P05_16150 [Roseivirga sp. BDSF3-8]